MNEEDLQKQIKAFGKSVAHAGAESRALVQNKLNEYGDVIQLNRQWTMSPGEVAMRKIEYMRLIAIQTKMDQLKVKTKAAKGSQRPKL